MFSIDSSPKAWLNQIYLNLDNFQGGSPHHYKVEFSYNHLLDQTSVPYQVQVNLPESFREFLVCESGLYQYQVKNPLELAPELRTQRWQTLCNYLNNYRELNKSTQVKVIKVLNSLCFHQAVLEYVPPICEVEITNNGDIAELAFSRVMSDMILRNDYYLPYDLKDLKTIAQNAPDRHIIRISAGLLILVELAKTFRDVAGAELWRSIVIQEIEAIKPSLDNFTSSLLMSIYYRAAAFVPFMHGNKERVIAEMNMCQAYAENLTCETQEQQIVAYENQNILLESRTKEALWLRDLDLAEQRVHTLIERNSLDPRYRIELGEVLLKIGRVEEAAQAYRSATRLGPPGTAVAWFMAGQCYQSLKELDLACDCYLACLRCDPLAISAVKRLSQVASALGDLKLVSWCELRLIQLDQKKQEIEAKGGNTLSYILAISNQMQVA